MGGGPGPTTSPTDRPLGSPDTRDEGCCAILFAGMQPLTEGDTMPLSLTTPPIVLASASPRRQEILRDAGVRFIVIPANIDESAVDVPADPGEYVRKVAFAKARTVAQALASDRQLSGRIVLGADTCVALDGTIYGKPTSTADATRMLRSLSGRTHLVTTGVALIGPRGTKVFAQRTLVTLYQLDDALVDAYVRSGEPMDKAGAYGIQGLGALLVSQIAGDYLNVVGLPLARTVRELVRLDGQALGQERA